MRIAGMDRSWRSARRAKCGSRRRVSAFHVSCARRTSPRSSSRVERFSRLSSSRGLPAPSSNTTPATAVFKLLEVNGRHNLSSLLSIRCGLNFPWISYRHLTTGELPRPVRPRTGLYWIDETQDIPYSASRAGRDGRPLARSSGRGCDSTCSRCGMAETRRRCSWAPPGDWPSGSATAAVELDRGATRCGARCVPTLPRPRRS